MQLHMQVVTRVIKENKFDAPRPEVSQSYAVNRINEMTNEEFLRPISEEIDEFEWELEQRKRLYGSHGITITK